MTKQEIRQWLQRIREDVADAERVLARRGPLTEERLIEIRDLVQDASGAAGTAESDIRIALNERGW